MNEYENAVNHYKEGLLLRQSSLPPEHPDIATSLYAIGTVLIKDNNPTDAEQFLRNALEIRQNAYDEGDWRIAQIESHLGRSLLRQQKFEDAELLLAKSHLNLEETLGTDNLLTQRTFEDLNELYRLTSQTNDE